jgi:O-antigen ligase
MLERCRQGLIASATAYLALLPSNALSFWRSFAFEASAALAAVLLIAAVRRAELRPPSPGRIIVVSIALWAAWSTATLAWSTNVSFTLRELRADVLWGLATMVIFYVAATTARGFDLIAAGLLAALAFWTALAVGFALSSGGWDASVAHRGTGAFATYLATLAPFLMLLVWRPPVGMNTGPQTAVAALVLLALVLITARMADTRILWIALAAVVAITALCVRPSLDARTSAAALVLILLFGLFFFDVARDRAQHVYPPETSVSDTLVGDPRIGIWKRSVDRIRDRPWHGHGYGLHILGPTFGEDAKVRHPHNLFMSQWLQTGAIGLALFMLMLGAVAARFVGFLRARDDALRRFGALGLAVLAAFVIRNLTDDFFLRANGKILFAANALLLGAGALRLRELRTPVAAPQLARLS